mgnify:CR=1 FL=1
MADVDTAVSAALKLIEPGRGDFLLESVEGGERRGRHSLIGLAPDLMFRAHGDKAEINRNWAADSDAFEPLDGNPLDALRALVAECSADIPDELPKALACLVGYFGYETIGLVEKIPRNDPSPIDVPDMLFARPTVLLVFDRLKDELFLVAPVWAGDSEDEARERLDEAERKLAQPLPAHRVMTSDLKMPEKLDPVLEPGRYADMVLKAKDYIEAGDIFQVVLIFIT